MKALLEHPYFEEFIFSVITLNCLFLSFETPVEIDKYNDKTLTMASSFFSVIFTIEACLRIIVQVVLFHKHAYLRDSFNVLDFIIVVLTIISQWVPYIPTERTNFVKAFRALRALRPLMFVSKNEGKPLILFNCS